MKKLREYLVKWTDGQKVKGINVTPYDIEDDETLINTFFDTWMDNDRNYYDEYEVQCISNSNGNVVAICFETVCEY